MYTHENYIHDVYEAARQMVAGFDVAEYEAMQAKPPKADDTEACKRFRRYGQAWEALPQERKEKLALIDNIKLVYGLGSHPGARGVTYYGAWKGKETCPAVEVCAFGQSDWTQVAGTTIHELAHVIAGYGAGHGPEWKAACELLGLRNAKAAGMNYQNAAFAPKLRALVTALPKPQDGSPIGVMNALGIPIPVKPKACGAAVGVRGGKSRGAGSGSRMVKCQCIDCGYTVRTTSKWLAVAKPTCPDNECKSYGHDMRVDE